MKIDEKKCSVIDFGDGNKVYMFPTSYIQTLIQDGLERIHFELKAAPHMEYVTEHNKEYLRLTQRQLEIHSVLMQTKMSLYPDTLTNYLKKQSEKYGICGDCLSSWIADWIAEREE